MRLLLWLLLVVVVVAPAWSRARSRVPVVLFLQSLAPFREAHVGALWCRRHPGPVDLHVSLVAHELGVGQQKALVCRQRARLPSMLVCIDASDRVGVHLHIQL